MVAAPVQPHERQQLDSEATPSIRMDPDEPWPCFDCPRDWQLYLESRKAPYACYDCDPPTQAEMLAQGRCTHPEMVFYTLNDQTIGVPGRGHKKSRALGKLVRWRDEGDDL